MGNLTETQKDRIISAIMQTPKRIRGGKGASLIDSLDDLDFSLDFSQSPQPLLRAVETTKEIYEDPNRIEAILKGSSLSGIGLIVEGSLLNGKTLRKWQLLGARIEGDVHNLVALEHALGRAEFRGAAKETDFMGESGYGAVLQQGGTFSASHDALKYAWLHTTHETQGVFYDRSGQGLRICGKANKRVIGEDSSLRGVLYTCSQPTLPSLGAGINMKRLRRIPAPYIPGTTRKTEMALQDRLSAERERIQQELRGSPEFILTHADSQQACIDTLNTYLLEISAGYNILPHPWQLIVDEGERRALYLSKKDAAIARSKFKPLDVDEILHMDAQSFKEMKSAVWNYITDTRNEFLNEGGEMLHLEDTPEDSYGFFELYATFPRAAITFQEQVNDALLRAAKISGLEYTARVIVDISPRACSLEEEAA